DVKLWETVLTLFKIVAASARPQWLVVGIYQTTFDSFLNAQSICQFGNGYIREKDKLDEEMLCNLPGDLHNSLISYLGILDRFKLRLASKTMENAVANSDFYVKLDDSCISFDVRVRFVRDSERKLVRRIMLSANFDNDLKLFSALENFANLIVLRKRLFKRAFAMRISIDLKNVHNETVNVVESLMEGCVFKNVDYAIHELRPNAQLRTFFSRHSNADLYLFIHGTFVDCDLLRSFTRPIQIHWRSSALPNQNLGWTIDDEVLIELVRRGHSFHLIPVVVMLEETILTLLKIVAASVRPQCLDVDILRTVYDAFLKAQSLNRTENGYMPDKERTKGEAREWDDTLKC
ncbi:hypothetical protein PRIPAC_83640, partial [Pristionchus pacificus]|uniref:F-box domain-containing protein n=1 Tax=Pristionchus pacificus TaxID=54126 RepID=A0A2A6BLW7_PRIPA